jgi:hypothetical protein
MKYLRMQKSKKGYLKFKKTEKEPNFNFVNKTKFKFVEE